MFWKTKVRISKQTYQNSLPFIFFYRLIGCFPFVAEKTNIGMFLKWSPFLALYSFSLGGFLVFRSYWELFHSYLLSNAHFQMSPTDKVTMLFAHGGWITVYFCGTFVMPCKFLKFFAYVECINEIDSIIRTTYTKLELYLSILIMMVAPILAFVYCFNNFRSFMAIKYTFLEFLNTTGGFYVLYVLSVTVLYIIRHLIHSVAKRLRVMNELLEKSFDSDYMVAKWAEKVGKKQIKAPAVAILNNVDNVRQDSDIVQLNKVYLKLLDAIEILNTFLGQTLMVGIVIAFVQLVQPLYFMIQQIIKGEGAIFNIIGSSVSVIRNLYCGLLIIEPAYACALKIKTTEKLVCHLLSRKMRPRTLREVKSFALCLGLKKMTISGCGLFEVNRFLFTSMIESAVMFMLLLLQMQDSDLKKPNSS